MTQPAANPASLAAQSQQGAGLPEPFLSHAYPLPDLSQEDTQRRLRRLAAAKATRVLELRVTHLVGVESDSVYGAAVAMPQVARTAGWSLKYTIMAIHSIVFLLLNLFLQGFMLYMLSRAEFVTSRFAGRFSICDFGTGDCPEGPNCVGPGGTRFSLGRRFPWELWETRRFFRDSLAWVFEDKAEVIMEKVDAGEYGVEDYYLRFVCCLLFVLALWPDLVGTWQIYALIWLTPSRPEPWIQNVVSDGTVMSLSDAVRFKVAGVPRHWKLIDFLFVLLPKVYIWVLTADIGIVFLMESSTIEGTILNCVALTFILSIDELTMAILSPQAKEVLESLEPFQLPEPAVSEQQDLEDFERSVQWTWLSPDLYASFFLKSPILIIAMTILFVAKYYHFNCRQLDDGSWVSKDIHAPVSDAYDVARFFMPWLPVPYQTNVTWAMPQLPVGPA